MKNVISWFNKKKPKKTNNEYDNIYRDEKVNRQKEEVD
jgi:hypothetical protein